MAPDSVEGKAAPLSLADRLVRLEAALPAEAPAGFWPSRHWAQARLHLRKARFLKTVYLSGDWLSAVVRREIDLASAAAAAIEETAEPVFQPGPFEAAYWCELDGSAQPFTGYLPGCYDGQTPRPLLVYLHGYSPYLNIINWSEWSPELLAAAEAGGFLVVAPFARGNTDFQGIGEKDVLRVIDEMRQRHRVAADRIILVGYSMGGMGAWTIAAHYPHLFAGALIVSGRACYYTWHGVRRETLPYYKQAYIDAEFGASLLPNLQSLPILCYHGRDDYLVPLIEARTMAGALQPINPRFEYVEIDGGDHWIFDQALRKPETRQWLERQRRSTPETFTFVSWQPRYARAHWLTLDPLGAHAVRRKVQVRNDEGRWMVHADPAGRVYWHPDRLPAGIPPTAVHAAAGVDLIRIESDTRLPPPPPRGPVKEFFLAPFLFVQAGDADTEPDSLAALRFADRCREWERYAQAPPRRALESHLDNADRQAYNIFLFGEPESSPMIREVLQAAPVSVSAAGFRVGDAEAPREGNGLLMVYRSPWHADRLVAIQSGHPWGAHLSVNHRYDYLPDIIVYGPDRDADGSNRALIAGFFNPRWELAVDRLYQAIP